MHWKNFLLYFSNILKFKFIANDKLKAMDSKKRKMWALIKLYSAIISGVAAITSAVAFHMEKKQSDLIGNERHQETQEGLSSNSKKLDNATNEIIKFREELGLKENYEEVMKVVLGSNYEEILKNEESRNELLDLFRSNSTIYEIINQRDELNRIAVEFNFIGNSETKNKIIDLLGEYKYESARKIIDKFITEKEYLSSEYQAQLYLFKALTYSGNDLNHEKRKEFIEKALELDSNSPIILGHYGRYLNYNNRREEAIKISEKALDFIRQGKEIEPFPHLQILLTISSASFNLEIKKSEKDRNFTLVNEKLEEAIAIKSKIKY